MLPPYRHSMGAPEAAGGMTRGDGWLVYTEDELKRNRFFADALVSAFAAEGMRLLCPSYEAIQAKVGATLPAPIQVIAGLGLLESGDGWPFGPDVERPLFVLNRSRQAALGEAFEAWGISVFNNSLTTALGNDKWLQYVFFQGYSADIPTLPTLLLSDCLANVGTEAGALMEARAGTACRSAEVVLGKAPWVVKARGGHGGKDVHLLPDVGAFTAFLRHLAQSGRGIAAAEDWILQRLVSERGRDLRVYILNGKPDAFVERRGHGDFRSNYSLGGSCTYAKPDRAVLTVLEQILGRVRLDYGAVDFIFDHGKPYLNEIEDMAGVRMLYALGDTAMPRRLARYLRDSYG